MSALELLFSPRGRVGWGGFLAGISVIALAELAVATTRSPPLMFAAGLAAAAPLFFLFAKRLRDMGAPSWPAFAFVIAELAVAWLGFAHLTGSPHANLAAWEGDMILAIRELGLVGMLLALFLAGCVGWGLVGPRAPYDHAPRAPSA